MPYNSERSNMSYHSSEVLAMKTLIRFFVGIGISLAVAAAPLPYDDGADAQTTLQRGLSEAQSQNKDVLVIFGANWCEDCRDLDKAMRGSSASLIDSRFVVVKIDVGNFDKNLDLAKRYGNPIQKGIPAAVVLSQSDQVLYSTKAGELANARRMRDRGIYDFFSKVLPTHQPP
jgi:thioredoxin 1